MVYNPIIWTNKSQYSATDLTGALNKTSNDASWSQVTKSTATAKGGSINMKLKTTANDHVTGGLSWYDGTGPNGSSANDQQSISYGIYSSGSSAGVVYVNSVARTTSAGSPSDQWEIIMDSTSVVFKRDGSTVYTANAGTGEAPDVAKDYYGVCSAYNTSTGLITSSLEVTSPGSTATFLPPPPAMVRL